MCASLMTLLPEFDFSFENAKNVLLGHPTFGPPQYIMLVSRLQEVKVRLLIILLVLTSLTASTFAETVENCPIEPDPEFRDTVIDAVCEFDTVDSSVAESFRAETRESHNQTENTGC